MRLAPFEYLRARGQRWVIPSLVLLAGLAACLTAQAQVPRGLQPGKAITQYGLKHWTTEQGLAQNTVRAILQTSDGYLWLGTQEGLVRFDGVRFTTFDDPLSGLTASYVTALAEGEDGSLWVGTQGDGLYRFADGRATQVYPSGAGALRINALAFDRAGTLWIGTADAGLLHLEKGRLHRTRRGLPDSEVVALEVDPRGTLWVGLKEGGLYMLGGADAASRFEPVPGVSAPHVTALHAEGGTLWVGTRAHGLFKLVGGTVARQYDKADGLEDNSILALTHDASGALWIGLDHGGIARLSLGHFERFSAQQGLSHDLVRALLVDREGSLWVGTDGGGLQQLWDGKVTTFSVTEGLPHPSVTTVLEDRTGVVWVGTEGGGVARIKGGRVYPLVQPHGLKSPVVFALAETPDGSIWIGTYKGGLARYRAGRFTTFGEADGLPGTSVYGLHTARDGTLWIATGQGLAAFDGAGFRTYTTADGLASSLITAIQDDEAGDLWVGTYDGGLNVIRRGAVVAHFGPHNGLESNTIVALHVDSEGDIWAGTADAGLYRIQKGRVRGFRTVDGLPSNKIFSIQEDASGRLWMTSNKGLFCLDRRMLAAYEAGVVSVINVDVYDQHDGLRSAEFTGGVQPAGWTGRDGRLWFPSGSGVVRIDPARLPRNTVAPLVAIEQLQADERVFEHATSYRLPAGPRTFGIRYTGLSHIASSEVTFRYQLEGVDARWVDAGTRREAFYTNLSPGWYTFRVQARNADGVWSDQEARVEFYLTPYFYQTRWFYLVLLLVLAGALVGLHRWRVQRLRERQHVLEREVASRTQALVEANHRIEEALVEARSQRQAAEDARAVIEEQAEKLREMDQVKTRFFNNISHEFRTPLTLNIGPLENALAGAYGPLSGTMRRQLSIMLRNARRLLRLINQLLDLSKLESGRVTLHRQQIDLVGFLEGVVLSFSAFAEKKDIRLDLEVEKGPLPLAFDPECFEKIFFNLVSNAVKFTPEGGRIVVRERVAEEAEGRFVVIEVQDTGCGIPESEHPYVFDRFHQVDGTTSNVQEGTGIGLALVKELVELHGGTISLTSTVGEGTTFVVQLPAHASVSDEPEPGVALTAGGDGHANLPEPVASGPIIEMAVFDDEIDPVSAALLPAVEVNTPPNGATLLIVDDNPDIREYMASCLENRYRTLQAPDGEAALEILRTAPVDLVLSDVMMPRLDGHGLCRAIKADPLLCHVPIVMLTARASVDNRIEGLEAGADDYLAKPFNARELLVRVDNLLALRRQQAALQEANTELTKANELKSQLLHIAAHDLRSPLNGIRGFADILRHDLPDEGDTHELLDYIIKGTDRMTDLISQVLEAEALESSELQIEKVPVDLSGLAARLVDEHTREAAAKAQQLTFEGDPGAMVLAGEEWLREALINLISNAIKYSPLGKPIRVRVERDDGRVQFSVRDEGPGIRLEERDRLFKKFQRLSARPTGGEASTGLGLSIVHHIVSLHDGQVRVDSEPGKGSTFVIDLPGHHLPEQHPSSRALPVGHVE